MSVIITGMDMPKSCNSYPDCCLKRYCSPMSINVVLERPEKCPLKSVDGLIEKIEKSKVHDSSYMYDWLSYNKGLMDAVEYIKEYCEVSEDADSEGKE